VTYLWIALAIVVVALVALAAFVLPRRRTGRVLPPPVETPREVVVEPPEAEVLAPPALETPEPTAGRLHRLRARLGRSQSTLGRGLLSVLSRDKLDEQAWEEIEEALLSADVGLGATTEIVDRLRTRTKVLGTQSQGDLRALLADELVAALQPDLDRTLHTAPHDGHPSVLLVVGVNGTGKTTTCGKLARVLVADGRSVLLGAADTFRAAAADKLQT
jgi:fused signal recognition particle receptor